MRFPAIQSWLVCSSFLAYVGAGLVGCRSKAPPEPVSEQSQSAEQTTPSQQATVGKSGETAKPTPKPKPPAERAVAAKPVASVEASAGDPHAGKFTLEEATQGLAGKGALQATITTDLGALECELYDDRAPITVATFVGLARGTRAWKQGGQWVKKPLYDGTVFHRVIKGFMIQGGDPNGNGSGGPGFVIPDEIWENAKHDQRGLLCMANRGPNTNGSQFFILDGKASHLDGGYTIFGKCSPEAVIDKLASVEVQGDRAVKPTAIRSVTIQRKP